MNKEGTIDPQMVAHTTYSLYSSTREEIREEPRKLLPRKNCIEFWESMLFHQKAFLPVATVFIIKSTIKHLQKEVSSEV